MIVTLLTDYGTRDSYVSEVKGVLLSGVPSLSLVDITHEVASFDVEEAAFQLWRAYRWYPASACHMAIVDPGVGSHRKCLFVRTGQGYFLGPDNGVLTWAVEDAVRRKGKPAIVYEIPVPKEIGPTFHGRDLFAPFLVSFLKGRKQRLKRLESLTGRPFPQPKRTSRGIEGEVLATDKFGNVVTNIPCDSAMRPVIQVGKRKIPFATHYDAIPRSEPGIIMGSHGFWEISIHGASAANFLKVKKRDPICLIS